MNNITTEKRFIVTIPYFLAQNSFKAILLENYKYTRTFKTKNFDW